MVRLREISKIKEQAVSEQSIQQVSDTLSKLLNDRADKKLVDKLQASITDLTNKLSKLLGQLQTTDKYVQVLSDKNIATSGQIEDVKAEIKQLRQPDENIVSLQKNIQSLTNNGLLIQSHLDEIQAKLRELPKEPLAGELRDKIATFDKIVAEIKQTLDTLDNKINGLASRPTYVRGGGGGIGVEGTPATNDFVRFNQYRRLEGRTTTQVKSDLDLEAGTDFPSLTTFNDHSARHKQGGDDEISIAGLGGTPAELTNHAAAADPHTGYIKHALATAANDFLVSSGSGTYIKKTLAETLTILLSATLAENDVIKLVSALSADGKYSGTTFPGTAGATVVFGDVVYLASSGKWLLAKGDAEATISPMVALVIVGGADTEAITLMTHGFIREDDWNWATIGAPVFISAATAGDMTLTELTTGQFQKVVGHVWDANSIAVNVSPDWVKVG